MKTYLTIALLLPVMFLGCGSQNTTVKDGNELKGAIDETLTGEEQAVQGALGRVLRAFQAGANDPEDLLFTAGDIDLVGGIPGFYDNHKRLYQWNFVGKPQADLVTVSLVFDNKDSGALDSSTEKREERTYSVTRLGAGFSVQRTK